MLKHYLRTSVSNLDMTEIKAIEEEKNSLKTKCLDSDVPNRNNRF